jgi:hypothetical protein
MGKWEKVVYNDAKIVWRSGQIATTYDEVAIMAREVAFTNSRLKTGIDVVAAQRFCVCCVTQQICYQIVIKKDLTLRQPTPEGGWMSLLRVYVIITLVLTRFQNESRVIA